MDLAPAEALKIWQKNCAIILDVRSQEEYSEKHIQGAINIPLNQLAENITKIPREKPILVICRSGRRSAIAVKFLEQQGFDNTFNVCGGILSWPDDIISDNKLGEPNG